MQPRVGVPVRRQHELYRWQYHAMVSVCSYMALPHLRRVLGGWLRVHTLELSRHATRTDIGRDIEVDEEGNPKPLLDAAEFTDWLISEASQWLRMPTPLPSSIYLLQEQPPNDDWGAMQQDIATIFVRASGIRLKVEDIDLNAGAEHVMGRLAAVADLVPAQHFLEGNGHVLTNGMPLHLYGIGPGATIELRRSCAGPPTCPCRGNNTSTSRLELGPGP
jgi:hypothetical protein